MERLFRKTGVIVLTHFNEQHDKIRYFATPEMLQQKIFIELVQPEIYDSEDGEDEIFETTLALYHIDGPDVIDYIITVDERLVVADMYLYQLVKTALEILNGPSLRECLKDLEGVCTGVNHSKELSKDYRKNAIENVHNKWTLLEQLYNEQKEQSS